MDKLEMEQHLNEYEKLCHELTDVLNGRDLNVVLPALAFMLASGGLMQGMSKETLIAAITISVIKVYKDSEALNTEELVH